ncbi:FliG C-terminal domain-containing protein [Mangrovibrevibacter kandeliae]|uniref:FliG C-terminal domain-containing protein n=1 Tax=Mangrovibrevibacter kandeliae TaxID=2968473 RepID=UPI002117F4DC|nr:MULTISPECIES: FliG C-terminal domain-containing protein [unclassified Aurantimonas]MCQ8780911.1 flagellar motor switch protein FliG [Aurantimonas sp. CSK15Z-1]MCW4113692.1 flagellar motor switch protein FliG [Aurantimonas sp. MSK8Z-1]
MAIAYLTDTRLGELPHGGAARAAILLLAMGSPGASRVLKHLTPDEIRTLRQSATDLEPVSREQLDLLVEEFQEAFKVGPGLSGPAQQMHELLQSSLTPEQLAALVEGNGDTEDDAFEIDTGAVWTEVDQLDHDVLGPGLAREHPQVVAVMLARLDADLAASIVSKFEAAFRIEVMRRMLSVKPLAGPVQRLFEMHIRQGFLSSSEKTGGGRHATLADIANRMDKRHTDELLESLSAVKPEDALALRNLLFAFEDVVYLPLKSRFVLFDELQTEQVIMALQGASEDIREAVLASLGARARRMVEAELAQPNGRPAADIAAARRLISQSALRLAGEGKIQLREQEDA